MKVLVTGAAGYIGSHVAVALMDAGHDVVVLDSLVRGTREAVDRAASLGRPMPLEVGDLCDAAFVDGVLARHTPSAVMHVAAFKSVPESVEHPERYVRNNIIATEVLGQAIARAGIRRVVYSSTGSVYGDVDSPAIPETSPVRPINPYAATKAKGERVLSALAAEHGWGLVHLRFFNVVGAHPSAKLGEFSEVSTNLVPVLLERLASPDPHVTVFGGDWATRDGTCVRDYVHVCDIASANVAALARTEEPGEWTCNAGTGVGSTVLEVVAAVSDAAGKPIRVVMGPRREGDPQACVAAVDTARRTLGWQARYTLPDMVAHAIAWDRARRNG